MIKTRFTRLIGIEYPIVLGPMAGTSDGYLAAAVCSAGGLGTIGGISTGEAFGPDYLKEQIHYVRSQTDRPFGVGFITHRIPLAPKNFEVVLEEEVPVILFSFADPRPWLSQAKESRAKIICQVQSVEAARVAVAAGADVLAAQGNEAGGHTGTMNLLPFLVRLIEEFAQVRVIAAGGISSGRSLAAVLTAGAEAAWLGTAFLTTREARRVSDVYKELIVQSDGDNTVYSQVVDIITTRIYNVPNWPQGIARRSLNNQFIREWYGREDELKSRLEEVIPLYREAQQRGDPAAVTYNVGESSAFINSVLRAAEVIHNICQEAELILRQRPVDLVQ